MMSSQSTLTAASIPSPGLAPSGTSNSPCAACKFLRRKCQPDCVFAPYFPPDKPQKFVQVHKVFGASNVTKLLNDLNPYQREDAVNSLAYEAETRLRDPVFGCVGVISILQHQLRELQTDLANAKMELAKYQAAATLGAAASIGAATAAVVAGNANQQLLFGEHFLLNQVGRDTTGLLMAGHGIPYDSAVASFGSGLTVNMPTSAASGVGSLGVQLAKQWAMSTNEEQSAVGPS